MCRFNYYKIKCQQTLIFYYQTLMNLVRYCNLQPMVDVSK